MVTWSTPHQPLVTWSTPHRPLVTWSTPHQPNGIITQYIIERRLITSTDTVTVVELVPAVDDLHQHLDESTSLEPHTQYEYRLAAQTSAGLTYSPWTSVITRSASQYSINHFYFFTHKHKHKHKIYLFGVAARSWIKKQS